jgi:hypothetical protein
MGSWMVGVSGVLVWRCASNLEDSNTSSTAQEQGNMTVAIVVLPRRPATGYSTC